MSRSDDISFLDGGGELGARMRAFAWEGTPLGPPASWPRSLKTAVRIMLTSQQPFWIGWGAALTYLYNDPYKSIIGGKHPHALGRPFEEVWREIWDVVGPLAARVMQRDEGTYSEAQLLIMERHGYREETYYTFSYSPIPDDDGRPGGLICANTDDTRRVIGERQLATLRELAARTADARTLEDACGRAIAALATNTRDFPFVLAYVRATDGDGLPQLVAASPGSAAVHDPATWSLAPLVGVHGPFGIAVAEGTSIPTGDWSTPPTHAVELTVPSGASGVVVLVAALNPFRRLDDSYRGFLELVAQQVAASLANAEAYAEERRRADGLAELDAAKTVFFGNVSHELRTPLTLILSPLQEAIGASDALSEPLRDSLQLAHRNGLRLQRLVDTLLDFSRIEAGRLEASYEPTELDALTRELAEVFRPVMEGAGLRFVVDCPPLGTAIHVDRQLWERILFNLLSNAFKYTLTGSVEVVLARQGDQVELRVRDTGCGIPAAELPRMFERFHRVAGTRGRTIEGTGIGLALVQELVKLHGGTIAVESEVDRGTELRVSIPIGTAHLPSERVGTVRTPVAAPQRGPSLAIDGWVPAQAALASPRRSAPPDAPRILVADDNADVRAFLVHLLGDAHRIESVEDGAAALAAARRERPDLVVTDVMMPQIDGFGLLAALRADAELADVPVILLSARAGEEARAEGIEAGADDYVVKPFAPRELLARVSARLELARMGRLLRAESRAMHELFAQTPMPTAVLRGRELVFERANDACVRLLGGRELLGRPLLEVLPELAGQGLDALMHDVLESGRSHVLTEAALDFARDASGMPRPSHWNLTLGPIREVDGRVVAVIVIGSEVTDEVRARASIAQSEARYREEAQSLEALHRVGRTLADERELQRILQVVTDAATAVSGARFGAFFYNVVDEQGGSYMLYTLSGAPREAFERFGLPRNTAIFAPTFAAEGPVRLDDVRADPRYGRSAPHHGMPRGHLPVRSYLAVPVVSRSGEVIGGLFFGHPEVGVFDERAERLVVGIASQAAVAIDNARLDEQRVELIERLRDGDSRKDEFLATLSHELRNPLAPLRSGLQMLRQPGGIGHHEQLLPVLERQVDHLVRLVDDLLEVSRISQGHLELRTQPIELGSIVANVADTMAGQIAAAGLALELDVDAGLWVDGDGVRLAQILTNLVTNATKYTTRGGTISIALRREGDEVVLAVKDTGCGISADALARVFDMFDRGDQASGLGPGGLGVGLSISRRLAQLHRGSLTASSAGVGRGSEFALRLPAIEGVAAEPTAAPVRDELPRRRVLVVDDNADAAEMLALLLEADGMTVHVADGGRAALELVARHDPEVVFLDIGMPELDGYEVARQIRARQPGRRPVLVALTGWGQQDDRRRVREAGFDHHLVKPAELETLRALLSALPQ